MPRKTRKESQSTCGVCEDREAEMPRLGICKPCYQGLWYWSKKTPRQQLKRAKQLDTLQARMEVSLGNVKRAKRKAA